MPKVFISHSTRDRDFVEREIIALLSDHGIETWYCKDDIRTADEWERTIFKGLESCEWFLLAMSVHAAESEWVKDEVHWAIDERPGRIVPVRIGDCKPRDFHIRLGRIQYVDFLENREEGRLRLLRLWGIDKIARAGAAPISAPTAAPLPASPPAARPQPAPRRLPLVEQRCLEGHTGAITCLAISPDGRFAASGSRDATARIWDLSGAKPPLTLAGHTKPVGSVGFFSDCVRILTSSADQSVRIFELSTGREARVWPQRTNWATALFGDHWAYSGSPNDNALVAWNPQTGHEYRRIVGHTEPVRSIALGRQSVVTTSRDQTLRIWDSERWQLRAVATVPKIWLSTVAVDASRGRVLAGTGAAVGIWDVTSGAELTRLHGHAEDVLAVAVSADGRRIVSGSVDGSVRVWDGETGQELACGTGHAGEVSAVAITPDGVHALSGGEDRIVRLWRMPE